MRHVSLVWLLCASLLLSAAGCGDDFSTHPWAKEGAAGPAGKVHCGDTWVTLETDPLNCGACGVGCTNEQVCSNGKCALFCEQPQVDCGGICADLASDAAHCGSCVGACANDHRCVDGACKLECISSYSPCGDRCVDLKADAEACGTCGTTCAKGELCDAGACKLPCIGGTSQCGESCVDLLHDATHCGGCGKACDAGWVCSLGQCAVDCQLGMSRCGDVCASTTSSPAHCGACGKACPKGQFCNAGTCQPDCSDELTACGAGCQDLKQSPLHCGGCGKACKIGEVCSGGKCVVSCQAGLQECQGLCVNAKTDAQHCGACEKACDPGNLCADGACTLSCPATMTGCDGVCSNVAADPLHCGACGKTCAAGTQCIGGGCQTSCVLGQTACDTGCASLQADPANCGACGKSCPAGHLCEKGACTLTCPAGQTPCSQACVDLMTDETGCGGCGQTCKAGQVCVQGACAAACPDGATNCGGTCADLKGDAGHCGACGKACGAGETCQAGACKASCKWPLFPCGGVCVDMAHNPNHCGGCGKVCSVDKATPACVGGLCQVTACAKGFANCDADPSNGCEVELLENGKHCGACNKTCTLYKATPSCTGGKCVVTTCDEGWGDCNGDPADGCEQDLSISSGHCGACNKAVKADQQCCDGKPIAGTTYAKDVKNCGGCGNVCNVGQTCCGGFCYTVDDAKICPECGKLCNIAIVNGNKFITTGAVSRLEASGKGISTVSNVGGKNKVETPRIWIATHDSNLVNRLDTGSGKLISVFPSFGSNPSRGAVALDDTFWIGNRCPGDPNNGACSNVAQLNSDGTQGCLVGKSADGKPLPFVRAIAVDGEGYVWLGTWNDRRFHKIDPLSCKAVADYDMPEGANPYGFAIDSKGLLWVSSPTDPKFPLRSYDTKTGKVVDTVSRPYNTYGVVVDGDDNAWFAGWCLNHLMKIDAKTKKLTDIKLPGLDDAWSARGLAVDVDGNVWAAVGHYCKGDACASPAYVVKFEKTTGKHLGTYKVGGSFGGGSLGVSMDANGRIWVTSTCSSKVARINKDTGATELVADLYGTNPYTYSDWTGAMLKNVTTHNGQMGVWTANFDGTAATSQWQEVTFDSVTPPGTRVRLRFRASSAIEAIEGAQWCVPAEKSPVDIRSCNFGKKRYLQVQVFLITRDVDVRPTLDNFKVYWQN